MLDGLRVYHVYAERPREFLADKQSSQLFSVDF